MEWVETTAKTIEEAKHLALESLGVAEEDADFDVLEEPKTGLFGRVRGEARVRARVRPAQARQKMDRRDRRRGRDEQSGEGADSTPSRGPARARTPRGPRPAAPGDGSAAEATPRPAKKSAPAAKKAAAAAPGTAPGRPARTRTRPDQSAAAEASVVSSSAAFPEEDPVSAEQVGQHAVQFLDGLVAAFGLQGTTEIVADGDDLEARVSGENLGLLVGPRGATLQSVQDLARVAAQRRLGDHDTRLRVDIGGYRERRKVALSSFAIAQANEVIASGVARILEPMSSADRKVIHDTLSTVDGIATRSEGDDPNRRVVIAPSVGA